MNCLEIKIDSRETLQTALEVIHDAKCLEENIFFQPDKNTLDIFFNRIIGERRLLGFFKTPRHASFNTQLHLDGIKNFEKISTDPSMHDHTFNCGEIDKNMIHLTFCEVLKIKLEFQEAISGILRDIEL